MKRRAAAGSPVPWHTCRNADVQRNGGTQSPTGSRVRETTAPHPRRTPLDNRPTSRVVGTFDVCSNATVSSDLSCFLYRGRLKQPYLHCRADGCQLTAAETSVPSAPYCLDTPLSFVSWHQRPCIWYAGEATSDGLIASTSTEVQVAIIPLTIGSIVGRLLVSILGSREIPFPGSR